MNIQDEIAALEAEIAAANARIAKANAETEASKRKAEEYSNRASKVEAEVLKLISAPNFPEAEKQRILAWRKRSIPTHSGWLYPLTFDAGKGLKEA